MDDDARRAQGARTRREVLGDAHVDRAEAATDAVTAPFQDFITRYAWGEVWSRDGLDRRSRSMITLGVLTALGAEAEIAMHVRAAVTNGLSEAEIAEVLLHSAVYTGLPRANAALGIARTVLAELRAAAPDAPDDLAPEATHGTAPEAPRGAAPDAPAPETPTDPHAEQER